MTANTAFGVSTPVNSRSINNAFDAVLNNGYDFSNIVATGSITAAGLITSATGFSGSGANLTALNASNLSSGTVPTARISGSYTGITGVGTLTVGAIPASLLTGTTLPATIVSSSLTSVGTITSGTWSGSFGAVSGANLTTLNASNISSGTLANARLPTAINISSTMQAYSYQGNANVAGTGNASYHPSGVYSTGSNWLYGTMFLNGNNIGDTSSTVTGAGQIYANGWFRSWGDTGWYNQTYGGGWYMADTSFVRIYNGKTMLTSGIWDSSSATATTSGYNYVLRGATFGNYQYFTSMREVKRNIQPIIDSGNLIDQMKPVTFQEKITDDDDETSKAWKNADLEYGFIADEMAEVGTGHLAQFKGMDDGTLKPVGWSFHGVVSVLVAEMKEIRKRLAELETA